MEPQHDPRSRDRSRADPARLRLLPGGGRHPVPDRRRAALRRRRGRLVSAARGWCRVTDIAEIVRAVFEGNWSDLDDLQARLIRELRDRPPPRYRMRVPSVAV